MDGDKAGLVRWGEVEVKARKARYLTRSECRRSIGSIARQHIHTAVSGGVKHQYAAR